jgi:hypothetical protein
MIHPALELDIAVHEALDTTDHVLEHLRSIELAAALTPAQARVAAGLMRRAMLRAAEAAHVLHLRGMDPTP